MTDHAQNVSYDMGFGENFSWDIPLLGGYPHRFLTVNKNWRLGNRKLLGVRLREPLQPLIARTGTKVVWTQGWQTLAYWQAVWQARRAGAQVWLRGESNDLSGLGGWLRRSAKAVALAALFRRVNHFLCIGSANRRLYRKYGVPDLRLHQAPYCVDNARFAAEAKKFRAMRKKIRLKWNIPETAFCVLFCGKFMRKKRPLDVVAAAKTLQAAQDKKGEDAASKPLHLLFVGSGDLGGALRAECLVRWDVEASATTTTGELEESKPSASFAGFLNQGEIAEAYAAADCLVLPSDTGETWGLVVNEAMASGLPCIASNACGCAEDLVAPVDRNCVFQLGDIGGLAAAIKWVQDGKAAGVPQWEDAVRRFDLIRTVDTVKELYRAHAAESPQQSKFG